jgi:hypothetical protein
MTTPFGHNRAKIPTAEFNVRRGGARLVSF